MTTAGGAQWVLCADVCRSGWAETVWDGTFIKGLFASTIGEPVDAANAVGYVELVAIDVPIGQPGVGPRRADDDARAFDELPGRCCWVSDAFVASGGYALRCHAQSPAMTARDRHRHRRGEG